MQDYIKKITDIIRENFSNGVRDDFININKILRIYSEKFPEEKVSHNFIVGVVHSKGIKIGERFYFISEDEVEKIISFCNGISEKYSVVFYSVIYEKNADFFSQMKIFSSGVLKKVLKENDKKNFYFDEFFSSNRMIKLDYEISKIFMKSDFSLSVDDLRKILPYVPAEKILFVLNTKKYLSIDDGKYVSLSKIKFDTEEIFEAEKNISEAVDEKNSATPEEYDLSSNFALNPEIPENILTDLIYRIFFADKFTIRGKNFFRKNRTSSNFIKNSIQKFLSDKDEVTLPELREFLGTVYNDSLRNLNYGFKFMIRVDENFFVKDSLINFDIAGIDEALIPFVQEKIISLRAVTSFTGFPPVEGYSWNLFLLESFLRKYSKKFSYMAPSFNNTNIGAIFPASMKFSNYLDIQVAVILQEHIPLEKDSVENFLIDNGYRANKIETATKKIIDKARIILS